MAGLGLSGGGALSAAGQQLASLNQLIQAQQRVQSMFQGLVNPDEENIAAEERRIKELQEKNADVKASQKFLFRLCVYSAEDIPRDTSYVFIKIHDQVQGEKTYKSNVSGETTKPVWEFFMEEPILVDSTQGPPRVEIQIYGQRVLIDALDRYLGSTVLKLPHGVSNGPVKSSLSVSLNSLSALNDKIASQFGAARKPRLHVVWQVCDGQQPSPDLLRIAEMDEEAADKKNYQFHLKVVSAKLRRSTEGPRRIGVNVRLIKPDGEVSRLSAVQSSPQVWTVPEHKVWSMLGSPDQGRPHADPDEECYMCVWSEDLSLGWTMPIWSLRESPLTLLSYTMELQVLLYSNPPASASAGKVESPRKGKFNFFRGGHDAFAKQDNKPVKLGVFRESLGDVLDAIMNTDQGIICNAAAVSKEGTEVATLRLEMDITSTMPHQYASHLQAGSVESWPLPKEIPFRRGLPAQEIAQNKVLYYVMAMVDGVSNHELCMPYVRISMGAVSECSEAKLFHAVNNVVFEKPLAIQSTLINRKAKIEILNKSTGGVFAEDKVIGQGVIYDVDPDKEYWIHCYGGAAAAPYPDVANQMVKGAVHPASTHTASVALKFGTKMQSKAFAESVKRMRRPARLVCRFHSGVNLKGYVGQKVHVVVKAAGCRLPDDAGAWHILRTAEELTRLEDVKANTTSSIAGLKLKRKALQDNADAPPNNYNTNLLSFPGEVDENGVLHFTDPSAPDKRLSWIERQTPADWPLHVPPNVQYAYIYIVSKGEEAIPPRVFARLRLRSGSLDKVVPHWKTLRYDTSVVSLPEAYFKSDIGGFILGAASMVHLNHCFETGMENWRQKQASKSCMEMPSLQGSSLLPPASSYSCCCTAVPVFDASLGEDVRYEVQKPEQLRTVYCHIDLLAARELPAMDEDGLVDPSYCIDVGDQTVLYPSGIMKSLSPSFMHRICIPVQQQVPEPPMQGQCLIAAPVPFPPIVIKILDRDERKVLGVNAGDTFEEVGLCVVKPTDERSHAVIANSSKKVDVFPLLGYNLDEEYVQANGGLFTARPPEDLDLNRHHTARWYALDKPAQAAFDPSTGVDRAWHKRPRVLVAANYSLQANLRQGLTQGENLAKGAAKGITIHHIQTHQSLRFKMDFSLLGVRNLPESIADCKLYVSSFWEGGAIDLAIGGGASRFSRNYNFLADDSTQGWRDGAEKLKPWLHLAEDGDQQDMGAAVTVKLKDLAGIVIRPPFYEVPVIPYLQQDTLKPGRWSMSQVEPSSGEEAGEEIQLLVHHETGSSALEVQKVINGVVEDIRHQGHVDRLKQTVRFSLDDTEWTGQVRNLGTSMPLLRVTSLSDAAQPSRYFCGHWHEEDPFVLLPALTFQLKNPVTLADHGALTVGLNQLLLLRGRSGAASWTQICRDEYSKLPRELKTWSDQREDSSRTGSIQPLRGLKYMDDSYETFVDVIASRSGFVEFDENLFIGRVLQDHCLLRVCPHQSKEDDGEDDGTVVQFFNPFDWIAGDARRLGETFDDRFWPRLCCGPGYDKESKLEDLPHIPSQDAPAPPVQEVDRLVCKVLQWLDAKERLIEHSQPRATQPLAPSKLFEKFFQIPKVAAFAGLKRADLESLRTTELQQKLKRAGWRFPTHLSAPELVHTTAPTKSVLKFFTDSQLHLNKHTFMAEVGHRIGSDRDSRILCRLRMDLPRHYPYRKLLEECRQMLRDDEGRSQKAQANIVVGERRKSFTETLSPHAGVSANSANVLKALREVVGRLQRIEQGSCNYFTIKFKLPGVVVWAAPNHQKAWDRPGTLLFAVRLLNQPDTVVPVVVPSFDLRYPQETSWSVCKTMLTRFHDLERRIARGAEKDKAAAKASDRTRRSPNSEEADPEAVIAENGGVEDVNADEEEAAHLGFSQRVAVSADAFLCRLKRRPGGQPFDREPLGSDWYTQVLGEVYPEMAQFAGGRNAGEAAKEFFFSKFMNLQRTLALPSSESGETVLKGHVNIEKVGSDVQEAGRNLDGNEFAVENLWTTNTVFVTLTLCTFTRLDFHLDCSEIYFKLQLGNEEVQTQAKVVKPNSPAKIISIYQSASFETIVPGAHELIVQAYAKGSFSDTLIGECKFDVEDRWLALKWKDFRCSTSEDFLRNKVSPAAHSRFLWASAETQRGALLPWRAPQKPAATSAGRGLEVRPARSGGSRMPLETKTMSMKDHDVNSESRAGLLRCFLDMHPTSMPEHPRRLETVSFEVRISVFDVDNIKVYKDFGQRNDLFVQMKFRSVNMDGEEFKKVEKTDIHRWANEDASFNQRFLFDTTAPCLSLGVEFSLMDFDRGVSSADLVYYPQTLSLDHLLAISYDEWTASRETIGPVSHTVVFDSWPSTKMVLDRWRCCRCVRRRINQGSYAKMSCTVEIVPAEVAAEHPVVGGLFAPPKDRLSMQMLATNPVKTVRVLLGPQLFNIITVGTFLGCSLVITFLIILTIYYTQALLRA